MTTFKLFLVSLSLVSILGADAASASGQESGEGAGHHGTNFFPKKQANPEVTTRAQTVELLEPKALAKITGGQTTLKWKEVAGADSYRVQVATDPNFKWLVKQEDFYKDTSLALTGLEAGKHYFWRVYAVRSGNESGSLSSFAKFSSFEVR